MARGRERLGGTVVDPGHEKGYSGALRTLEVSRPTVAAQAIGIARAAYEYALDYATSRVQFGYPIITNEAISFLLADMATEIEAARLLCWHAAWMGRNAQEFDKAQGSMAKRAGVRQGAGLDGQAQGRRSSQLGHRPVHQHLRWQGLRARAAGA